MLPYYSDQLVMSYDWSFISLITGAGTVGTVKAGTYKPKNGGPEVECAIKALKPVYEFPNQKVREGQCVNKRDLVGEFRLLSNTL